MNDRPRGQRKRKMSVKPSVLLDAQTAHEISEIGDRTLRIIEAECELRAMLSRMRELYQDLGNGPAIVIRPETADREEVQSYHAATHSISRAFQKVARVAREMAEG
ncbi:MAG: hypothetical protein OXH70_17460 [Acidobacteria bacterium]|nr:hypothetical protein [Acidobacteriota bacterium]